MARALSQRLLPRPSPHAAHAPGLEPEPRHLLEHRRLDAPCRDDALRPVPVPPHRARGLLSRPGPEVCQRRLAHRHHPRCLGARPRPAHAVPHLQPRPPHRPHRPLHLRILSPRAQIHPAGLLLHLHLRSLAGAPARRPRPQRSPPRHPGLHGSSGLPWRSSSPSRSIVCPTSSYMAPSCSRSSRLF